MTYYLPWINLFAWILLAGLIIWVIYRLYQIANNNGGSLSNIQYTITTGNGTATDAYTIVPNGIYLAASGSSGLTLTLNPASNISTGNVFSIYNGSAAAITVTPATGVTISNNSPIATGGYAQYLATNNTNAYIRIQ